jgi:hypothetical protein
MSLYHALFGLNPFSNMLLEMLGTTPDRIPRYRDCYLNEDGSEIIIHTRTGGGNRSSYEKGGEYWEEGQIDNDALRALPGFKSDADDDFDCTYADFHYEVPEAFRSQVELLRQLGAVQNPGERWQKLLTDLKGGDTSKPGVKRALEVGEKIMGQINAALEPKPDQST